MAISTRITSATLAGLLIGLSIPAAAQRPEATLSREALAYVEQDPSTVLTTLKAGLGGPALVAPAAICQPLPQPDPANGHHYFLSEVGGCAQLACFLQQVPGTIHANATLIVDQACTGADAITQTLVLPGRFTLAGVGIDGEGVLAFDLPDNAAAIRFAPSADVANRMTTIRDLNIVIGENTTAWRVRDSVASQGLIGIDISATARGHVVSGGRVEGNWGPGIRIAGAMNVVDDTWFEGNGQLFNTHFAIAIAGIGQKNRILSNLFSSQLIGDAGKETRSCFNMSFANDSADVNQC
jgi:hypothetical protein